MNLCDEGHQEICFDGRECPLCEAIEQVSDLRDKVRELEREVDDLTAENAALESQIVDATS